MSVERLQAAFHTACLGVEGPPEDLRGFLEAEGVAAEDVEALVASPRRLGLYRRLVRHNVTNVVGLMLERTKKRLEGLRPGAFEAAIGAFLEEVGPRTSHLRDVPAEMLAHAAPRWRADASLPPWLADFAELELSDFTIGVAPRPLPPPPLADVAADRPLVFAEPKALLRLSWAVHELDDEDLARAPERRGVAILVYRDAEHITQFLELTLGSAAILAHLFAGEPLAEAVAKACAESGLPLDPEILGGAARLLADLGERGVLLGAREAS